MPSPAYLTARYPTVNHQPTTTMTFYDLQTAVTRLANDPRVHPHTKLRVELLCTECDEPHTEDASLVSIALQDHTIILSSARAEPAVAR